MFGIRKTVEYTFPVNGMMCGKCVQHVEKALMAVKGVKEAKASLEAKTVTVRCVETITEAELRKVVTDAGYETV